MSDLSGSERLVKLAIAAIQAGTATPEDLFDFGNWSPSNFVFSPDGRYLYGSSYYSGVSNIFRYDFSTNEMEPLSNAETGFFRPVPLAGRRTPGRLPLYRPRIHPSLIANQVVDSVSAIRFLGNEIAASRPEVQSWMVPPASRIAADSLTTSSGSYRSLHQLKLDSAYPIVEGTRMRPAPPRRPAAFA